MCDTTEWHDLFISHTSVSCVYSIFSSYVEYIYTTTQAICTHIICAFSRVYTHTGWPRLIGSPKLQIIFHKKATKYRPLLRKMTYKDKGSYESSPPCNWMHMWRVCIWNVSLCILDRRIICHYVRIICVTQLNDMTRSYRTYQSVVSHVCMSYVTQRKESCHTYEKVVSHIWMSHVIHMNESCHTYEGVMSQICMSRVTHMYESCHTYEWVMSHIWMSHVTHLNESCHTYEWVMSHVRMSRVTHRHESCHT